MTLIGDGGRIANSGQIVSEAVGILFASASGEALQLVNSGTITSLFIGASQIGVSGAAPATRPSSIPA